MKFDLRLLSLAALASSAWAVADTCGPTKESGDETQYDGEPIDIVSKDGTTVTFTVSQTWSDDKLCLVATHFESADGEVCPMSPNVGPGLIQEYEAVCDAVTKTATIKIYAYDPSLGPSNSPAIEAACEQTPAASTYEYVYTVPCEHTDTCPEPDEPTCLEVSNIEYHFATAPGAADWLFGSDAYDSTEAALVLDSETLEISQVFDIPKVSMAGLKFTFSVYEVESVGTSYTLQARVGPYYLNLSSKLKMAEGTIEDSYGQVAMKSTKDASGVVTFEATLPAELYETGSINLGVRFTGDGKVAVDDVMLDFSCFDDGTTSAGGGGGDPHFQRWDRAHSSFHGECDLVMVHSDQFHNGVGMDLHVRTTIEDYFSYIESAALRVGETVVEFHKDHFFIGGVPLKKADLPISFGDEYKYTISEVPLEDGKKSEHYQYYMVDLHQKSNILLKFYKQYLTIGVTGHSHDFSDSTGLLGEFGTGEMIDRDGEIMSDFDAFGFEWQVTPEDGQLFLEERAPQLPFERCRMPTAARPSRRRLRGDQGLFEAAKKACAHVRGSDFDLCTDDVMTTGDIGLASVW